MLKQWHIPLLIGLATIVGIEGRAFESVKVVCEKQGLQSYPESSAKYIYCLKFPTSPIWYYYVFNCPLGTFDQESMACINRGVNPCDDFYKSENKGKRQHIGGVKIRDGNDSDSTEVVCP